MDTLEIPVNYKNKELSFKARVIRLGYVNHIVVDLNGVPVTIKRDEEGNYRAIVDPEKMRESEKEADLVKEVIKVLQAL